ncbi:TetR/AcrR family transcriptional regulator [Plantactinospora sp. GCM10030261]|uniref:TetR/AcrR family transcriptional regulator n=1 Tax=Plantactinospora sp. GCM10030261 TaxID=3273420 RepID=UPI00360C1D39
MSSRQRLLDATVEQVTTLGIGDLSLRQLAAALGTSHRMLIYHFGSKEGLLVAVVQEMERRQRDALRTTAPDGSPVDLARQFWRRISDPELWSHERLFFEVYGQALQGRPYAVRLLDGVIEDWVAPVATGLESFGLPEAAARAEARLGLAVVRGLLLDLLATGDRAGVDDAMETYLESVAARLAALPTH